MALEAAGVDFRDRWKASAGQNKSKQSGRFFAAVILFTAALLAIALAAGLLLGPVFTWQTACVTLVIDEYPLGMLEPVPFGAEDSEALGKTLSGSLHTRLGSQPVNLTGFDSVQGVRDRLLARMRGLDIRSKDVLLAYVRGQSFIASPVFDDMGLERDSDLAGVPCLLASDCQLTAGRPAEIVPVRSVVEAVGASPARVTLVALDLGDLQWDPRLGVLGHLVPTALDQDFAESQEDATSDNWIIGSHDLFQVSSVSISDKRSCFGRAFELALGGGADSSETGNNNGVIELDEVVRFVSLWTNEWTRRLSGGRSRQTPVVWKLGVGRVALSDVPPGIALLRVPSEKTTDPAESDEAEKETPEATDTPPQSPAEKSKTPVPSEDEQAIPPGMGASQQETAVPDRVNPPESAASAVRSLDDATSAEDEPVRLVAASDEPGAVTLAFPDEQDAGPNEQADEGDGPASLEGEKPDETDEGQKTAAPPGDAEAAEKGESGTAGDKPALPRGASPGDTQGGKAAPPGADRGTDSSPKKPLPPPLPGNVWEALSVLGKRKLEPAIVDGSPAIEPVPADYAAPWWRSVYAIAASAESRAGSKGPSGARGRQTLASMAKVLARMAVTANDTPADAGDSPVAGQLWESRLAASEAGYFPLWAAAPDAFCRVVATRNEALATLVSANDIVGRASGGTGTPPLDPATLVSLAGKVRQLNDLLASGADTVGIGRLTSAARAISSQQAAVMDQLQQLADGLHRDGSEGWSPDMNQSLAALRSPVITESTRQRILENVYRGAGQTAELQLVPTGRPSGVLSRGRQIDQAALQSIATLVGSVAATVEAAIVSEDSGDLSKDIASVRREVTSLSSVIVSQDEGLEHLVHLGGSVGHLLTRVGEVAGEVSREPKSKGLLVDQQALLFRVMDVRDIPRLESAVVTALPDWSAQDAFGLSLEPIGADGLQVGQISKVRFAVDSGGVLPSGSQVRFLFDPAALEVRLPDGSVISPDIALPVESLKMNSGALVLSTLPRQYARRPKEGVSLGVIWESPQQAATAKTVLPLPANRSILLGARSSAEADWVWSHGADASAGDGKQAEVDLVMVPGSLTNWQLGFVNQAEISREFTVSLYNVNTTVKSGVGPVLGRDVLWQRFAERIERDESVGPALATIEKLAVPVGQSPVAVVFPEKKPEKAENAAEQVADPKDEKPAPVGPDLGLVVREQTKGQPARQWLFRLRCDQLHPRGLVEASAVWSEVSGTITFSFSLSDAWGQQLQVPSDGVRVAIAPLSTAGSPPVEVRRQQTVLSEDRTTDTLVASWNGSTGGQAPLVAVHVNEYPRAFVFQVACEPSQDGRPQAPLNDWRMLRVVEPASRLTVLKAPAVSVPLSLQVDTPRDASVPGRDGPTLISLGLRQLAAGAIYKQPERIVWMSEADRDLAYTLQKAEPPVSLAIQPTAADWRLDLPGEGFVDVDVEAEVQLVLPGSQSPMSAVRQFVFDGRPPLIEVPASVNVDVGMPLVIPVQVSDDPREEFAGSGGRHLPGVSGVDKVEWAFDLKGDGMPEEWMPAVSTGGVLYEVRADTKALPVGARVPLLVRAVDKVGLAAPPRRVWLMTGTEVAKGRIQGRVVLDGRGEANVSVSVAGPGAPTELKSGKDGVFLITDLEAGEYELRAAGVVRNVTHTSDAQKVKVELPPAPPVSVVIQLK